MAAARRIAKKRVGKVGVSKTSKDNIKVLATVTIETSFKPYDRTDRNNMAIKQIQEWVKETLEDSDTIPLFINSQAGEETGPKKVKVKIERVKK